MCVRSIANIGLSVYLLSRKKSQEDSNKLRHSTNGNVDFKVDRRTEDKHQEFFIETLLFFKENCMKFKH